MSERKYAHRKLADDRSASLHSYASRRAPGRRPPGAYSGPRPRDQDHARAPIAPPRATADRRVSGWVGSTIARPAATRAAARSSRSEEPRGAPGHGLTGPADPLLGPSGPARPGRRARRSRSPGAGRRRRAGSPTGARVRPSRATGCRRKRPRRGDRSRQRPGTARPAAPLGLSQGWQSAEQRRRDRS